MLENRYLNATPRDEVPDSGNDIDEPSPAKKSKTQNPGKKNTVQKRRKATQNRPTVRKDLNNDKLK